MNKHLMIILAYVMVLSFASCSAKPGSSAEASTKTAAPEQTAPQETEPVADVSQEAKPEAEGSLEANSEAASSQEANSEAKVSQEPEADPVASMFNGLWITNSSIGTLYGKGTRYLYTLCRVAGQVGWAESGTRNRV